MMRKTFIFLWIGILLQGLEAQELRADVNVNFSQVQTSNTQIFSTLEKSLREFINNTKWTQKTYKAQEKIECSFTIVIMERPSTNEFKATLTIQSRRPIYNSNYFSPVLNIQDPNFTFKYSEFETLVFNPRRFSGKNLTDVMGYYVYLILGYDSDTFQLNGGTEYFNTADKIVDAAVNQGFGGWDAFDGLKSRATLIGDILKPQNNTLRNIYYNYHINGLDKFYTQELYAKNNIANNLLKLKQYQNRTLFYPLEIFVFAKKEEIASLFSGGISTTANLTELSQTLNEISPKFMDEYWSKIKK